MGLPEGTLLALLALGFVVAEYALWRWKPGTGGPDGRPDRGWRGRWWPHAGVVLASHLVFLLPFLTPHRLGVVVGLAAAHLAIEAAVGAWRRPGTVWPALEQALHAASLLGAWLLMSPDAWALLSSRLRDGSAETVVVVALAYSFAAWGGNFLVVHALSRHDLLDGGGLANAEPAHMGRAIGIIERTIALTLVLVDQWGTLGLFFAAKELARGALLKRDGQDADHRFGDYYLIGTFTSFLVAVLTGLAARAWLAA